MPLHAEITVAAIVERHLEGEPRFLLVEESIGGRLVLNQPAGHLEEGETLLEAAIREAREETAWRFHPEHLVGVYLWRKPDTARSFLRFAFCGHVDQHDPHQPLDRGIQRALWLSRAQLAAQPGRLRSPMVMRCVDDYRDGRRLPLDSVATLSLRSVEQVDGLSVVNL